MPWKTMYEMAVKKKCLHSNCKFIIKLLFCVASLFLYTTLNVDNSYQFWVHKFLG